MIETTRADGIHTILLAHGKANAMDIELFDALRAELRAAADARAVVITARGSIFSAGVDLYRLTREGAPYVRRFLPALCAFVRELFELPVPVIVAANGHAIAGGAIVVLAGDYRLMAAGKGRIGVNELLVGVRFPTVPLEVVRFAVPADRIQSLVYTGATLLPEEAKLSGLIDEVVDADALMNRAYDVARQLARIPGDIFRAAKLALRAPTLARMAAAQDDDAESLRVWSSTETIARVKRYLDTLQKR